MHHTTLHEWRPSRLTPKVNLGRPILGFAGWKYSCETFSTTRRTRQMPIPPWVQFRGAPRLWNGRSDKTRLPWMAKTPG